MYTAYFVVVTSSLLTNVNAIDGGGREMDIKLHRKTN